MLPLPPKTEGDNEIAPHDFWNCNRKSRTEKNAILRLTAGCPPSECKKKTARIPFWDSRLFFRMTHVLGTVLFITGFPVHDIFQRQSAEIAVQVFRENEENTFRGFWQI